MESSPQAATQPLAPSDSELLSAYRLSGCADSFAQLVQRHSARVFATCFDMLRDAHAADDATQATFLILARKAKELPDCRSLGGWLFVVARSCARMVRQAASRRSHHEGEAMSRKRLAASGKALDRDELRQELFDLLETLPEQQRSAILLRHYYGLPAAEAARQMNCSEHALHARVNRGLVAVRQRLVARESAGLALLLPLLEQAESQAPPADLSLRIIRGCTHDAMPEKINTLAQQAGLTLRFASRTWLSTLAVLSAVVLLSGLAFVSLRPRSTPVTPAATPPPTLGPAPSTEHLIDFKQWRLQGTLPEKAQTLTPGHFSLDTGAVQHTQPFFTYLCSTAPVALAGQAQLLECVFEQNKADAQVKCDVAFALSEEDLGPTDQPRAGKQMTRVTLEGTSLEVSRLISAEAGGAATEYATIVRKTWTGRQCRLKIVASARQVSVYLDEQPICTRLLNGSPAVLYCEICLSSDGAADYRASLSQVSLRPTKAEAAQAISAPEF